jgi:hypothetical protein
LFSLEVKKKIRMAIFEKWKALVHSEQNVAAAICFGCTKAKPRPQTGFPQCKNCSGKFQRARIVMHGALARIHRCDAG